MIRFSKITILLADERGRWWIVGSAWCGQEKSELSTAETTNHPEKYSVKLLSLAKKQRMNTETRRNIFCIIMSAEVSIVSLFSFIKHFKYNNVIYLFINLY